MALGNVPPLHSTDNLALFGKDPLYPFLSRKPLAGRQCDIVFERLHRHSLACCWVYLSDRYAISSVLRMSRSEFIDFSPHLQTITVSGHIGLIASNNVA